jgi:hypothetical protein
MKKKIIAILIVVALLTVGLTAIPIMAAAATPHLNHVQLTPGAITMVPAGTQQFTAQSYDENNQPLANATYFWLLTNGGGTLSPTGLFTAGTVGAYQSTVEVIAVQGTTTKVATATITIVASIGPLTSVKITPATADVKPGATKQFTAQGYDAANVAISGLIYTFSGPTGSTVGSVNATGLFTAGTTAGSYIVTVSTVQGSVTVTGTATVTVGTNPVGNGNHGLGRFINAFKGYWKTIGSDNFLGGQWQVKNGTAVDTYKLTSGVVQTASTTSLVVMLNGQTTATTYALTASTVIEPKNTTLAAQDKVLVMTVNDQVTRVVKIVPPAPKPTPTTTKPTDKNQGNNNNQGSLHGNKNGRNK